MTHILVNPGYAHCRRSRTADLLSLRKQLAPCEFDRIRSESREAWLADWEDAGKPCVNGQSPTTYSRLHSHKVLDRETKSRPTSPTRRNNPHPTKVFLHLNVLKDKGYPTSHSKTGQNPYADKYHYEANSHAVPQGTMYYTLKDIRHLERTGQTEMLKKIMNFEQPNETWLNTPYGDAGRTFNNLPRSRNEKNLTSEVVEKTFKPVVPSLHRWLMQAGKEEKEATRKIWRLNQDSTKSASSNLSKFGKLDPNRYLLHRYESTPRVTIHRPYRTDFVIHPELHTTSRQLSSG